MAATVKAVLNGQEVLLTSKGNNVFEATLTAPGRDGVYEIALSATNPAGDRVEKSIGITVDSWITPKVDWKPTDRFNISDFNRIRGNILSLIDLMFFDFGDIEIKSMGESLSSYTSYWNVDYFNAFEKNIEILQKYLPLKVDGKTQNFYMNGPFIKYDELNRIENLLLQYKQEIKNQKATRRRLPFRLGTYKEFRA